MSDGANNDESTPQGGSGDSKSVPKPSSSLPPRPSGTPASVSGPPRPKVSAPPRPGVSAAAPPPPAPSTPPGGQEPGSEPSAMRKGRRISIGPASPSSPPQETPAPQAAQAKADPEPGQAVDVVEAVELEAADADGGPEAVERETSDGEEAPEAVEAAEAAHEEQAASEPPHADDGQTETPSESSASTPVPPEGDSVEAHAAGPAADGVEASASVEEADDAGQQSEPDEEAGDDGAAAEDDADEYQVDDFDDDDDHEGNLSNPIRAMRVIKIEESKKRYPSAPVVETEESSIEAIEEELGGEDISALSPAKVPDEAVEPITEVEPVSLDEPPEVDSVEEVEAVEEIPTAPAPAQTSQPPVPPADRKPPPPRRSARPSLPKAKRPRKKPWWETVFGDDFSRAYRPLSQAQLSREVDFILESLELPPGSVILDLACGQGEVCVELARRGYSVVGYDLSVYQLAMAGDLAQQAKQKINFLQGDMREMAFEEMFDAVISWDTSLGYFEDDKNLEVLQRVKKALKPGGRFMLDLLNRDFAAREAPHNHWFEGDGCVCMDDMSLDWITNRLKIKRSIILDDGRSKELHYAMRLYTLSEIGRMLHDVGFRVSAVSGDVATKGAFFGPHSRRIIIQSSRP